MNKACKTNTKLDNKCPSSFVEDNHSDVSSGNNIAHINGLVNGLSHETIRSKKQKKSKRAVKITEKSICNDELPTVVNAQIEQLKLADTSCSTTVVNNLPKAVDADSNNTIKAKSRRKKNKLDTNENISSSVTDPNNTLLREVGNTVADVDSAINLFECLPSCSKNCDFSLPNISSDKVVTKLTESLAKLSANNEINLDSAATENVEKAPSQEPIKYPEIKFVQYESELQMPMIMKIIQKDLSEPYSIYTYRYFIHNWPKLCFLAMNEDQCVGAIVCKLDLHRKDIRRGYIAMLAVDQNYRKLRIGSTLVQMAINEMIQGNADEVVLETEVTNKPALQLYEKLGFVRDKRLFRYYLNGVDALRLKLWLT